MRGCFRGNKMQTYTIADFRAFKADPDGVIYVIRDGETIFYVGMTRRGIAYRLSQHLEHIGSFFGSHVGEFIAYNHPESDAWQVEAWDREDCAAFIVPRRPEWGDRWDYEDVERRLIVELRPYLNRQHNVNPSPLPSQYRPIVDQNAIREAAGLLSVPWKSRGEDGQ